MIKNRFHIALMMAACLLPHASVFAQEMEGGDGGGPDRGYPWQSANSTMSEDGTSQSAEEFAKLDPDENEFADEVRVASSTTTRRFHEVLDELLAEFAYDVKMGQIKGLKNVSVRRVDVSEAIPHTYKRYLELLVTERIRENSQIRLVSCVPCKSKTSRLVEGKLMITSPSTNMVELGRAADQLGIDNFMDVVLVYHTTHMVLAFQVFNTKTKETLWARTYNSETIKSRYQKLAIDFTQVDKSRESEEYIPEYRLLTGLGGASIPQVGGTADDSGMMAVTFRATEKFNNRKNEFGLLLGIYLARTTFVSQFPTSGETTEETEATDSAESQLEPFTYVLGLNAVYVHNFVGPLESYNQVRHGYHVGGGVVLATGYLAPAVNIGWDTYFGRRFVVSPSLILIGPSKILVGDQLVSTAGGVGGDVVLSLNF